MHLRSYLVVFALSLVAIAAPTSRRQVPSTHALHEKRHFTSSKWTKRGKTHPDGILPLRIGLTQSNLDSAYDMLMDVSDPDSSNYGKHWTTERVIDTFKPSEESVTAVKEWLLESGISSNRIKHTDTKGWLAIDITTKEAEDLLHTDYYEYMHSETGHVATACDEYHIPHKIREHIDYITPGIKLFTPTKRGRLTRRGFGMSSGEMTSPLFREGKLVSDADQLAQCDEYITPICVSTLYQVPALSPNATVSPNNSLGIFEEGDFYAQEDLNLFFANFTPYISAGTGPTPAFIDGASAPVSDKVAGGESDLDFELSYPLIYPQTITLFQTDDLHYALSKNSTTYGGFNTFLDAIDGSYCTYSAYGETGNDPNLDPVYPDETIGGYKGELMCGVYNPTNVISVSYGGQEYDLPAYYQQRQCNEFMKLGLQGVSIFYASGDDGVAGPGGDDSRNGCLGAANRVFSPAWPNSCPYVSNLGATKVYAGHTVWEPESACNDLAGDPYSSAYSSGGGFSNIYPIPDYQAQAVADYFKYHDPGYKYYYGFGNESIGLGGGLYNRGGRGYPDFAANGDNIAVYVRGGFYRSGGTSASTPIFASIVTRINEERISAGKGPVGFVNPALYKNPWALNDITNGSNPGCGTDGFSAVKGWDPVTGLGTPNYPKMLQLFMSLP